MHCNRMIGNCLAALPALGLAALLGEWDALTTVLACMMAADYLSGVIAAALEGRLSSQVGWKGVLRKVAMMLVILAAALADGVAGFAGHPLRTVTTLFYIGNEGISLVENLGRARVPIPRKLLSLFAQLKKED